ncbi:hypothetical protein KC327_g15628, partial [Hortaea werneckii]
GARHAAHVHAGGEIGGHLCTRGCCSPETGWACIEVVGGGLDVSGFANPQSITNGIEG